MQRQFAISLPQETFLLGHVPLEDSTLSSFPLTHDLVAQRGEHHEVNGKASIKEEENEKGVVNLAEQPEAQVHEEAEVKEKVLAQCHHLRDLQQEDRYDELHPPFPNLWKRISSASDVDNKVT